MELIVTFRPVSGKSNAYTLPAGSVVMRSTTSKNESVEMSVIQPDGKSVKVFIDKKDLREAARRLA